MCSFMSSNGDDRRHTDGDSEPNQLHILTQQNTCMNRSSVNHRALVVRAGVLGRVSGVDEPIPGNVAPSVVRFSRDYTVRSIEEEEYGGD
jgi:hypothetical protein